MTFLKIRHGSCFGLSGQNVGFVPLSCLFCTPWLASYLSINFKVRNAQIISWRFWVSFYLLVPKPIENNTDDLTIFQLLKN